MSATAGAAVGVIGVADASVALGASVGTVGTGASGARVEIIAGAALYGT